MKIKGRITVGCNVLTSIDSMVYPNHCQFWYRLGKNLPEWQFPFFCPRRTSIDNMRNATIVNAIQTGSKYVFFYDDDVVVPGNALPKLLNLMENNPKIAVASGLTYIRKYPFQPMLFKGDSQTLVNYSDFRKYIDTDGILYKNLGAVGFSCVLINVKYLENLKPPYCLTGSRNTEDVYLCRRIIDHYPEAKIVCDTTIDTAHLCDKFWVDDKNVEKLRKFENIVNEREPEFKDRGAEYAKRISKKVQENIKPRLRRQPHHNKKRANL